jgi:hypothetical protein
VTPAADAIQEHGDPPGLSVAVKHRVLAAVRAEPAPTRSDALRRNMAWLASGVLVALAIFFRAGGVRPFDRPLLLILATSLGWFVAACVSLQLAFVRGRSMLGRPSAWLLALIVGAPFLLLAWKVGVTRPFGPAMSVEWHWRQGWRCCALNVGIGLALLVVFLAARRRTDPLRPGIVGAALGMAAGLCAGTLIDLWCPVAHLQHLLIGHILPLIVLAAIGWLAGRRVVRL